MQNIKELLIYKILRVIYFWILDYFLRPLRRLFIRPFKDLFYIIKNEISDHFEEKRLGIKTVFISPVQEDTTMFKDSTGYVPTPYKVIRWVLSQIHFSSNDVFIDLGCGKGRVILMVAEKRLKKVIGIEAQQDMLDIAKENLKKVKINNTPVETLKADAATFDMNEGTIFFMFYPFGANTQKRVLENIKNSLIINPRKVQIICYNIPNICDIIGCDKWLVLKKRQLFSGLYADIWQSNI